MTKRYLIILIVMVIVCAVAALAQRNVVQQADTSAQTRWEYGLYRGHVLREGKYVWSWLDATGHFYRTHMRQFLVEMGVNDSVVDGVADSEAHILELYLFNALGEKGWELCWTLQKPPSPASLESGPPLEDRSWCLFKRPKSPDNPGARR